MLSQTQDSICCSRCGQAFPGNVPGEGVAEIAGSPTTPLAYTPGSPVSAPPPCPAPPRSALESWDLDEDLRHIERLLRRDGPKIEAPAWHAAPSPRTQVRTSSTLPQSRQSPPWWTVLAGAVSWLLICAGLAATVCGIVLLSWTWLGGRPDLLIPGLACAAAGQFGLLGGFLIQPAPHQLSSVASSAESELPGAQWLDLHRHIDDILRADLPPGRGSADAS